jgi:hypothetical protein
MFFVLLGAKRIVRRGNGESEAVGQRTVVVVFFPVLFRGETMGTAGLRRCCGCGVWFRSRGRNAWHQRYCSAPACQVASKRASQRKWCRKNPGYFHGEVHVQRVRAWRRKHPGYWKKKGVAPACAVPGALQEFMASQGFGREEVKAFRSCLSEEISRPLQDVLAAQQHALVGLASLITGEALQEDIAGF